MIVEDGKRVRRLYELTMSHWGLPLQINMARDGFRLIAALRESDLYKSLQIVVVSGLTPAQIRAAGGLHSMTGIIRRQATPTAGA